MKDADFQGLAQGMKEAHAYARGERVDGLCVHIPEEIDVVSVRRKTSLSEAEFSNHIGISTVTLRNWEHGRQKPGGPARVLLSLIDANPRVVQETLARRDFLAYLSADTQEQKR